MKSFKEVYDETRTRVTCYMVATTIEWIRVAWRNKSRKEKVSLKKEAEKAMRKVEATVSFDRAKTPLGFQKITSNDRYCIFTLNFSSEFEIRWKQLECVGRQIGLP